MTKFYMGYSRSRPNSIPRVFEGSSDCVLVDGELTMVDSNHSEIPILTNAIQRWSEPKQSFLDPFAYDTDRAMDSGGYNVQASWVDRSGSLKEGVSGNDVTREKSKRTPFYPWEPEEYHNWLSEHSDQIDWAACMDYACEERFDGLLTVDERIELTVRNAVRQFNDHSGEYELVPVLQGRTVEDYVKCFDMLRWRGIPTKRVGLGTVCRLSSSERIVELEREIRKKTAVDSIHGFGVKVNAYSKGASFETADSHAWVYKPSRGEEIRLENGNLKEYNCDDSLRRTVISFREYYRRVMNELGMNDELGSVREMDSLSYNINVNWM